MLRARLREVRARALALLFLLLFLVLALLLAGRVVRPRLQKDGRHRRPNQAAPCRKGRQATRQFVKASIVHGKSS
jgi:hypothetical protein